MGEHDIELGALAERAKRHEPRAFAELFDAFFEKIRRYAYYQTGDLDRAEDIAADVIKSAIESIDRFDERSGLLSAWLYGIARNHVSRYFKERGQRPQVSIDDAPPLAAGAEPEELVLDALSYHELYQAISRLPGEQREVIILRYIEGYRSKAVAEILGKRPGAVRALQHRAIASLKKALEEPGVTAGWQSAAGAASQEGSAFTRAQEDSAGWESSHVN